MQLQSGQRINCCARAIIIEHGQLLTAQWLKGYEHYFLIGGRVDFGEPVVKALHREIYEETDALVTRASFAYFSENMFHRPNGTHVHEYGWYFVVELDRIVCQPGEVIPNPDHEDIVIRHVPFNETTMQTMVPTFLKRHLVADYQTNFVNTPRYLYSNGEVEEDYTAQLT